MEREKISLPPTWCAPLCRNSMNDVCVEGCAVKRDCSYFRLKKGINLVDMPRFPIQDISEMTKEEKFTSVAVYISKIVDHLQGAEGNGYDFDYPRSGTIFEAFKVQGLLHGSTRINPTPTDRPECENKGNGSNQVDRG